MVVELSGTIRGETERVRWDDGSLSGSPVLLARLDTLCRAGQVADGATFDPTDLGEAVRALELAAAQRLHLKILEDAPHQRAS